MLGLSCNVSEVKQKNKTRHKSRRESRKLGFKDEATTRATKKGELDKNNNKSEDANSKTNGCSSNSK